jgi:hypothetical protein
MRWAVVPSKPPSAKAKQSQTLKCLIFEVNPRREIHYDVR